MKVQAPLTITEGMLTSSTLTEAEHSAYAGGTTYAAGDLVIYAHRIYESLQASNTGHTPGLTASATWWLDTGPTNKWAMFDGSVSTASEDTADIEVVITPGAIINSVACISAVGTSIRVQMHDGATSVYDETQSLDSTPITDWAEYFFADQVLAGELIFEDLPRYLSATVTVTIADAAGTASIGVLTLGTIHELGETLGGASAGITDYSRKSTDDFGTTTLTQRTYAKRSQQRLWLNSAELRRVQTLLAGLRATPCVWVGSDNTDLFSPLVIYGWFRSFSLDITGQTISYCSIEIEGLT
ncbi:MAG: hypothetical protein RL375_2433 [Pseudomonadota bacterium]|jgi:hypothetical protein